MINEKGIEDSAVEAIWPGTLNHKHDGGCPACRIRQVIRTVIRASTTPYKRRIVELEDRIKESGT